MNNDLDVTDQVSFENSDDESLPLTKCVCGQTFESWHFNLSVYRHNPHACPNCHRRLYFCNHIRVYEVRE